MSQTLGASSMKVDPLTPQAPRPWALISPGWDSLVVHRSGGETVTAQGPNRCRALLAKLAADKAVCYARGRLADLRLATDAREWTAELWRGTPTTMRLDGTPFRCGSLRGSLDGDPSAVENFSRAMDWLAGHGVSPGSLSSMSWALWRRTLAQPFQASFQAKVGRAALYGGRQEATPQDYTHMVQVDIAQAYPHSMVAGEYASTLMEVSPDTYLDPELPGIARAKVTVPPDLPHPPLPRRIDDRVIRWEWGTLTGTWTWRELHAAAMLGCAVRVERCWAPLDLVRPFDDWYNLQLEGREISPVIKAMSVCLWGMFGMTGDDAGQARWIDPVGERVLIVPKRPRRMPHASMAHLAAETSSRVRERVLLEGLCNPVYGAPAHVDTDGILVPHGVLSAANAATAEPGQWRVKTEMSSLQVRGPQVYRYRCGQGCGRTHGDWHYVTAGIPPREAARLFDRRDNSLNVSVEGHDWVAPRDHHERLTAKQLRNWGERVHTVVYGPGLARV